MSAKKYVREKRIINISKDHTVEIKGVSTKLLIELLDQFHPIINHLLEGIDLSDNNTIWKHFVHKAPDLAYLIIARCTANPTYDVIEVSEWPLDVQLEAGLAVIELTKSDEKNWQETAKKLIALREKLLKFVNKN